MDNLNGLEQNIKDLITSDKGFLPGMPLPDSCTSKIDSICNTLQEELIPKTKEYADRFVRALRLGCQPITIAEFYSLDVSGQIGYSIAMQIHNALNAFEEYQKLNDPQITLLTKIATGLNDSPEAFKPIFDMIMLERLD